MRVLALCGFTQNAYIYSKQVCWPFLHFTRFPLLQPSELLGFFARSLPFLREGQPYRIHSICSKIIDLMRFVARRDPKNMQRCRVRYILFEAEPPASTLTLASVFLEPPHVVEKVDMPWNQNPSELDSDAAIDEEEQTPETTPRAWWLSTQDRTVYRSSSVSRLSCHVCMLIVCRAR